MPDLRQELRLAIRALRLRPAFTALVALTLALGIGANTAIFSVVKAVLLTPLPYRAPDQLALVWSRWTNFDKTWLSEAEYLDYQRMDRVFEDVAAWSNEGEVTLTGAEGPESVAAAAISANLFSVLGVAPELGRPIAAEEDVPNGPPVVLLGHDLWQRRYGGDRSLVGRQVNVDGTTATIVGVLPRRFRLPLQFQDRQGAQVFYALQPDRANPSRGNHGWYGVGRLRPGATVGLANSELTALTHRWTDEGLYPPAMRFEAFAAPVSSEIGDPVRPALILLSVAVGLLLLLACANVANLMLTRAGGRSRELAVRAALGAGRVHLLRLTLLEGMLLSLTGGAIGLGLAWAAMRLLVARAPTTVPRLSELSVDGGVLLFTLAVSLLTGLLCGLVPALRATRQDISRMLHDGARGQSAGVAQRRSRSMLVVSEMALAVLLVIGAGLTIRSFRNLLGIDPGFRGDHVLTLRLSLPATRYVAAADVTAFYDRLGREVRQLPGVTSAGFIRQLPLASDIGDAGLAIESKPLPPGEPNRSADWQAVTPGWFEAMRIPLVKGRLPDEHDLADAPQVIVINEALARQYFDDVDPIGQRIRLGGPTRPWRTVVGVVGDVHHHGLLLPVKRAFFVPLAQWGNSYGPTRSLTLTVRTTADPKALGAPIERLVKAIDPDLPLTQVATLEEVVGQATREQRFTMGLMSGFAALALVLAAVGIYGVIAFLVAQRTREIGIRMALGADEASVRRLVLRQGLAPAAAGIGVGLVAAALLARFLSALLYGVAPLDPLTFSAIPLLLLLVAAGAVIIPATRASRVHPIEALRVE